MREISRLQVIDVVMMSWPWAAKHAASSRRQRFITTLIIGPLHHCRGSEWGYNASRYALVYLISCPTSRLGRDLRKPGTTQLAEHDSNGRAVGRRGSVRARQT